MIMLKEKDAKMNATLLNNNTVSSYAGLVQRKTCLIWLRNIISNIFIIVSIILLYSAYINYICSWYSAD
jgi:hypothetical protein